MLRKVVETFLFLPTLAMLGCAVTTHSSSKPPGSGDLANLAEYRKWTLVNPTPQLMDPLPAISCAVIPGREKSSPHLHKYISVFVNPVGRDAMMTRQLPKFPVGSMIVKEKLGSPDSTTPEVLTAMIKREPGYNPESGDWEYLVLDGPASKIVQQGKLARCSGCHQAYKQSDFVTRTYLPPAVRSKLAP